MRSEFRMSLHAQAIVAEAERILDWRQTPIDLVYRFDRYELGRVRAYFTSAIPPELAESKALLLMFFDLYSYCDSLGQAFETARVRRVRESGEWMARLEFTYPD